MPLSQFDRDERNRKKHVESTVRAFKSLLKTLVSVAERVKTDIPGRSQDDIKRRGRLMVRFLGEHRGTQAFLDKYIGNEVSWRRTTTYKIRDYLVFNVPLKNTVESIKQQAAKSYQSLEMEQAQAPVREALPETLRVFLPRNIVVDADADGHIQRITDRFENKDFTLEEKIKTQHKLIKKYNAIAKKVKQDLRSGDERTKLSALVTALIMETGIRPGRIGNKALQRVEGGEKVEIETFGAVSLGPEHVRFVRSNFVALEFVGKKTTINIASLTDADVIKVLESYVQKALQQGSKFIFVDSNGQPYDYKDLASYFKKNFKGFSPTDFRKLRATEEILNQLKEQQQALYAQIREFAGLEADILKQKITDAIVETLTVALENARAALSHKNVSETRDSYINPEVVLHFLSTGRAAQDVNSAVLDGGLKLRFDPQVFLDIAFEQRSASTGFKLILDKTAGTLRQLLEKLEGVVVV